MYRDARSSVNIAAHRMDTPLTPSLSTRVSVVMREKITNLYSLEKRASDAKMTLRWVEKCINPSKRTFTSWRPTFMRVLRMV